MKMKILSLSLLLLFVVFSCAQKPGTVQENQPPITVQECSAGGSCRSIQTSVTIDSNWRWTHNSGTNCYTGNSWDTNQCPNPTTCAANCAVEGVTSAEYRGTYGITSSGNALNLGFVTTHAYGKNVGSRVYLMQNTDTYQILKLLNKEFSMDVDSSQLECGLNGAVYFVEMAADGGKSQYPGNKAGAKFGTGYCDAQCPHDIKFINGEANTIGWTGSSDTSGKGQYGACCAEMDVWEANKISTAFTPHPCDITGAYRCLGNDCGDGSNRYSGVCDKDGCDFNSFRMGNQSFYGPNKIIDTTLPVTLVTQFITHDGTDNGDLVEIRRIYKQNGKIIKNSATTYPSLNGANSISDEMCNAQKTLFGNVDHHQQLGGLKKMGEALKRGMVLALSLWVDYDVNLLWLDSNYPVAGNPSTPGVARGTCPTSSGVPNTVISTYPNAKVTYSNIKWGPLGSTTSEVPAPSTSFPTNNPTSASSASSGNGNGNGNGNGSGNNNGNGSGNNNGNGSGNNNGNGSGSNNGNGSSGSNSGSTGSDVPDRIESSASSLVVVGSVLLASVLALLL